MKPAYVLMPLLATAFALTEAALVAWERQFLPGPHTWARTALIAMVFAQVSLAVLWGAMVRLSIGWRVALATAVPAMGALTVAASRLDWYLLNEGVILLVGQAILLSAVLLALSLAGVRFGRLPDGSRATSAEPGRWQTSIGSLLLLTTTTAASLSLLKWLLRVEDLLVDAKRNAVEFAACVGDVGMVLGLAFAVLATAARGLRATICTAGLAVGIAMYGWMTTKHGDISLVASIIVVQCFALAIGLAVFRACGWRIAWRRRPLAATLAAPLAEPLATSPFARNAEPPGAAVSEPETDPGA